MRISRSFFGIAIEVTRRSQRAGQNVGRIDRGNLAITVTTSGLHIEEVIIKTAVTWRVMRRCPYIVEGLRRAGFRGGWLGFTQSRKG